MKRFVLVALVPCLAAQAEDVASSNGVNFYAGASLIGSLTSSDFKMDYEVDTDSSASFFDSVPCAKHKKSSIARVGVGINAGIKKKFNSDWFIGSDLSYVFNRASHKHDFTMGEDLEVNDQYGLDEKISYVDVKHGDEVDLSLKFGREFKCYDVYGILGITTKQIKMRFGIDDSNALVCDGNGFEVNPKKRVWGAVFGLGGSRKINDRISCSLEYRYKVYSAAKKSVDCRALSSAAFADEHDISDRNFKVKSDKHELSLGVTFNI